MAAVAVVEPGEGAELGLHEGEADLPGAAFGEQTEDGERGPALPRAQHAAAGAGEKLLWGEWGREIFERVRDWLKHVTGRWLGAPSTFLHKGLEFRSEWPSRNIPKQGTSTHHIF